MKKTLQEKLDEKYEKKKKAQEKRTKTTNNAINCKGHYPINFERKNNEQV